MSDPRRNCRGITLVEVVMAMAVLGVALPPVTALYREVALLSVDQRLQRTAVDLAEALMEEVASKAFSDPQGSDSSFGQEEAWRSGYDDVDDYDGLDESPPALLDGTLLSDHAAFRQRVTVDNATTANPNPITPQADGSTGLKRIRVIVSWTGGRGGEITLTTLRARLEPQEIPVDLVSGSAPAAIDTDEVVVTLQNLTADDLVVDHLELSCTNSDADGIDRLTLGGATLWSASQSLPTGVLTLTASESARTLDAGASSTLLFRLEDDPPEGIYDFTLVLIFDDGTSDHVDFLARW